MIEERSPIYNKEPSTQKSSNFKKPPLPTINSEEMEKLHNENEKLIYQLRDFAEQMETRIHALRSREQAVNIEHNVILEDNPELKDMMITLGSKSK